ncbi:hypothetical protein FOXB_14182 [Fusarium oxysporum f. sp. conglutinans Fo5176]|uniref:Uncharacterized protein n=1 Tax=Fusarium oxysporum (strain Fo5176) TaxID=660025 RepID=F9G6A0_FUSOF|nr:hypothetical protein FOXB_14182 [Fusarium oxysporum f. sp. conglutinans Fo5176]
MVVVAVAGGTGGIGGAIIDTLRPNPYHMMIILTRKSLVPAYANHLFIANTIIAIISEKHHSITHAFGPGTNGFHTVLLALELYHFENV